MAGADAVIADLEDSVAPHQKVHARAVAERVLQRAESGSARILRVNGSETEFFKADRDLIDRLDADAIVLPKASPDAVGALGAVGPPVLAIVETSIGLHLAAETAMCSRVVALALGVADLSAELGLEQRSDGLEILYARSKLVIDSAVAGIRPPIDVVHLELRDLGGLEQSCRLARSLGFRGKLCVHPDQVPVVNRIFTPTHEEVLWAKRVIDAHERGLEEGQGVLQLEGQMIDTPIVERARRVLDEGGESAR